MYKMTTWNCMTLKDAFLTLLEEQKYCDVEFSFGENTIGAHKAFLQARSKVFEAWINDHDPAEGPIEVKDLSLDTFKAVLRYIYSEDISVDCNNVFQFLFCAKIFELGHLESLCAQVLSDMLTKDNMCEYLEQTLKFSASTFHAECLKLFSEETCYIMNKPEFLNLSAPALGMLLDADEANVVEIELFERIKRWIETRCASEGKEANGHNMRRAIGDHLYKIRFPTMTLHDFANEVATIEGFLNDDEVLQTYKKISFLKSDKVTCPFPATFRCTKRVLQDGTMNLLGNVYAQPLLPQQNVWYGVYQAFANWNSNGTYAMNKKTVQLGLQFTADMMNCSSSLLNNFSGNANAELKAVCMAKAAAWQNACAKGAARDMKATVTGAKDLQEAVENLMVQPNV